MSLKSSRQIASASFDRVISARSGMRYVSEQDEL
jgi:hypothetical protein